MNAISNSPIRRRGINTIEILGCLIAIGGGMWIGANYFGADLEGAAYQALDETDLLAKVPEEWRPKNPECPDGDCPDPAEVRAADKAALDIEFQSLQSELTKINKNQTGSSFAAGPDLKLDTSEQLIRDRTLAYWQSLNLIVAKVASVQNQLDDLNSVTDRARANSARRRAFDYGVQAINLIDQDGVDPRAIDTGVRLAEWFGQGIEMLQRAGSSKAPSPVDGRTISPAQFFNQGETEYGKRTEFVRRKVIQASDYLESRYLTEFKPFDI